MSDAKPMDKIRGSVLVADNVYQTLTKKWVIAGTYSFWSTSDPVLTIATGLGIYCRFQVEKSGIYPLKIKLIDRVSSPTVRPLLEIQAQIAVPDPAEVVEFGLNSPKIEFKCPIQPTTIEIGKAFGFNLTVWLQVDGHATASCPLRILFRNPNDTSKHEPLPIRPPQPGAEGR